jgi:hypothetical protein
MKTVEQLCTDLASAYRNLPADMKPIALNLIQQFKSMDLDAPIQEWMIERGCWPAKLIADQISELERRISK